MLVVGEKPYEQYLNPSLLLLHHDAYVYVRLGEYSLRFGVAFLIDASNGE